MLHNEGNDGIAMLSKRFLVVAVVVHCWRHATAIFHAMVVVECWKFLSPKPHDDSDLVTYQYGDGEIHLDFLVVAVAAAGGGSVLCLVFLFLAIMYVT